MNILAHIFWCFSVSNTEGSRTFVALCLSRIRGAKLLSREVKPVYAYSKSIWELWGFYNPPNPQREGRALNADSAGPGLRHLPGTPHRPQDKVQTPAGHMGPCDSCHHLISSCSLCFRLDPSLSTGCGLCLLALCPCCPPSLRMSFLLNLPLPCPLRLRSQVLSITKPSCNPYSLNRLLSVFP